MPFPTPATSAVLALHCTAAQYAHFHSYRPQRHAYNGNPPTPSCHRLGSPALLVSDGKTLVAVRCQHGCTPARIAADNDMRCALFTLHLDCPCLPSAGASQAPRLMRCPVWRPLAALRWRCTCARLLPCRILLGAQLLSICSCFSIANSGPSLDPAAYSLPRRCDWHASLPIRS